MPHYFLHLRNHGALVEDPEGEMFADLEDARSRAILSAREIMSGRVLAGRPADGSQFEIADADGAVVLVVPFEAALAPPDCTPW